MLHLMTIAIGGAAGAVLRHLVNLLCHRALGGHFALGTLVVNVSGCFLLGWLAGHLASETPRLPEWSHAGLGVGFLGALTTFSTFGLDTWKHVERDEWLWAGANLGGNLLLGLAAVAIGIRCGR